MTKTRVAIVEDSPVMQAILQDAVIDAGYDIAWTGQNGQEAIDSYQKEKPDVLIMDIIMPMMNGMDALTAIIKNDPTACIIIASSISDARTVIRCLHIGARRYLVKPYSKQDIAAMIETVLTESANPDAQSEAGR